MTIRATLTILSVPFAAIACGSNGNKATPDAPSVAADAPNETHDAPSGTPQITLTTAGGLGARIVDSQGKTLYFFANDIAGANASTYSGAAWPAFDASSLAVGPGLNASDFGQFNRTGGGAQTTWKGRPLYYYANDTTASPTAGEGLGGRWFVARDYDLFFGASSTVTPQGGSADTPFLTDGPGRTLYVYQLDTRGSGGTAPTSACSGECATHWPLWPAPASLAGLALPSTITATNLTSFTNGTAQQLAYMGWPLYYYGSDTSPGQVAGAGIPDWYTASGGWDGTLAQ